MPKASRVLAVAGITLAVATILLPAAIGLSRSDLAAPESTPILEDRTGGFLSEGERTYDRLGFWKVEGQVGGELAACFVEIEDRRFYLHPGFDPAAAVRAFANNLSGGKRQGGSTIAMQVALMQHPAPRTLINKVVEAWTAVFMTARHGREAVLRHYLRLVPQGNQAFGVAYAARRYFQKPLADLTLEESALLAALPRAPGLMNPFSVEGFLNAKKRARLILDTLRSRGRIDAERWENAVARLDAIKKPEKERRPENSFHFILRALDEERLGARREYSRPLRTSLDPATQAFAQAVADRAMEENGKHGAGNVAIVVAERESGAILAYVGSRYYYDNQESGSINYARTPRSSGSTLKPFLFALGLDSGRFTPASVLADLPFSVLDPRGEYSAKNFDDSYLGPMLYRRALANSRNVPALRVLEGVGTGNFHALLAGMGLARDGKEADYHGYGLAIGGLYVTLEDLVAAYGSLANDGRAFSLGFFGGSPSLSAAPRYFSSYAARTITGFLADPTARVPSFPRQGALEFPFPVAVKTGTSQGYRDAWTVAYTRDFIAGVWMGDPENRPMNHVAGVVTAGYAASLVEFLHPEQIQGIDISPFPESEGVVEMDICPLSGAEAGPDCASVSRESFMPENVPKETCRVHRRLPIDRKTGRLAGASTRAKDVEMRAFAVLPPEYAAWGAKNGYSEPPPEYDAPAKVSIAYPLEGARFFMDPGIPAEYQSIPLKALVAPRAPAVTWWIDGRKFAEVPFPYETRFPLSPGRHRISLTVPGMPTDPGRFGEISVEVE